MNRGRPQSPFRAGLVAIVLTAVTVFLLFMKGVPGIRDHYTVRAVFTSSTNLLVGSSLRPGSPVRIAGVDVGQIAGIERGPGDTALVSMRIDDAGRPIRRDATAKIRPRLFLEGNFFVDLSPGSPSAQELDDGATLPLTQTAVPVQLDQVLDALDTDTRAGLKTVVREYGTALRGGGAQGLNRGYPHAAPAFRAAAIAAEASQGRERGDLRRFVDAAARTTRALAERDGDLTALIDSFAETVTALTGRTEALSVSLQELRGLARDAPPQLLALDRATVPLNRFSVAVRDPLAQLRPALDDALPFLGEVARLVAPAALPALTRQLRPTIRTLADVEPDLAGLLSLVAPVSACVRDRALPVLEATVDDGPLSTGQPVWEEVLHAATGLTSATQNFDGTGYSTRYSFGTGEAIVSLGEATTPADQLFALGTIDGSRPARPDRLPPFRPNAPCEAQQFPDLRAETSAPVGQRRVAPLDPAALRAFGRLLEGPRAGK